MKADRGRRSHSVWLCAMLLCAFSSSRALELKPGREPIPNAEVFTGTVSTGKGYSLEVFVTKPRNSTARLPVVFQVAWLSCDSVEQPKGPEDGFTQLLWDIASNSGFATFRVNKPGVGRSSGLMCSDLDFATELAAYRAAFVAMKELPFVDSSRIYVIGFSNGAAFAPLVAGDSAVRGYLLFSGWYKTWLEHMLEHERRRLRLSGTAEPEISGRMRQYATFYELYLNEKFTPREIIAQHPEFKPIWYDEPEHQYGRPAAFYQQLQELNLAGAWDPVTAPVLAVHGEFDWVMSSDDQQLMVNALNSKRAGQAQYVEWPRTDHVLYSHAAQQRAFGQDPGKTYDKKLSQFVLEWLSKH